MATGGGPAQDLFKNRRDSLKYYTEQMQERPPEFLRAVETIESDPLPIPEKQPEVEEYKEPEPLRIVSNETPKVKKIKESKGKRYNFSMNKFTIFGFMALVALGAALIFAAGAVFSYVKYPPIETAVSPQKTEAIKTEEKSKPEVAAKPAEKPAAPSAVASSKAATPSATPAAKEKTAAAAPVAEKKPAVAAATTKFDPSQMSSSEYIKGQIAETLAAIESDINLEDRKSNPQSEAKITSQNTEVGFPDVSDALLKNVDDKLEVQNGLLPEGAASNTPNPDELRVDVAKFPFAIELNAVDSRQTAIDIVGMMKSNGLNPYIAQDISENGAIVYHVRLGAFKDYNQASVAMMKLTSPYSQRSKVVKLSGEEKILR